MEKLRYLLGDIGIDILMVMMNNPMNLEEIKFASGSPMACIKGRIPVLKNFGLIVEKNGGYIITEKGEKVKETFRDDR